MTGPALTPEQRFAGWLTAHGTILRKLSRAYTFTPAEGEELHQEMLVQLWRSAAQFRAESQASTWIYRVCLNTALTWQRDRRRRDARIVAVPAVSVEAPCPAASPADAHEREERLGALLAAVRALPPADCSLIVLALDGLSHREIGEITGLTENHVGVALLRARRKLAVAMKGLGHEL